MPKIFLTLVFCNISWGKMFFSKKNKNDKKNIDLKISKKYCEIVSVYEFNSNFISGLSPFWINNKCSKVKYSVKVWQPIVNKKIFPICHLWVIEKLIIGTSFLNCSLGTYVCHSNPSQCYIKCYIRQQKKVAKKPTGGLCTHP